MCVCVCIYLCIVYQLLYYTYTITIFSLSFSSCTHTQASQDHVKTPLAQKLDEFGQQLTYIIGGICLAVWGFSYPEFSNPVHGSTLKVCVCVCVCVYVCMCVYVYDEL
jgi:hypothetical protein